MAFKKMATVGLILFAIGGLMFGLIFSGLVTIPSEKPIKDTIKYDIDGPKEIFLEKGNYDIWFDEREAPGPGEMSIVDEDGDDIFKKPDSTYTEGGYKRVGSADVRSDGNYNITMENSVTLYLTPPRQNFFLNLMIISGILMFIGGIIIVGSLVLGAIARADRTLFPPPRQPSQPVGEEPAAEVEDVEYEEGEEEEEDDREEEEEDAEEDEEEQR